MYKRYLSQDWPQLPPHRRAPDPLTHAREILLRYARFSGQVEGVLHGVREHWLSDADGWKRIAELLAELKEGK